MSTIRDVYAEDAAIAAMIAKHGLDGIVCIPRAEYEAYKAAAKALALARAWEGFAMPNRILGIIDQALAALRAAGIHETEGGER